MVALTITWPDDTEYVPAAGAVLPLKLMLMVPELPVALPVPLMM